ncbi:AraC family transcriptional regulator [Rheinheimera sp.]|uniref:AraC family transcriptional regulator n=1 Tax=Rheinheimera sp. TaxID=1869214 RepID=UPI002733A32A|nr:AraC family transcriptional regulator [Rheinheimera sp.]MDP2715329.1 AraC family transcriptional regulator [Rheinheimera sp.]
MHTELSSPLSLDQQVPGTLLFSNANHADKGLLVQIFHRHHQQNSFLIPAVPEPLLVWVVSGEANVGEREPDGEWHYSQAKKGDFFLTSSSTPSELCWQSTTTEAFIVMHLYLSLPLLQSTFCELYGRSTKDISLKELSAQEDPILSFYLRQIQTELMQNKSSQLMMQGLGQSLTVYLLRNYIGDKNKTVFKGGLPAFKLQKVLRLLEQQLTEPFQLSALAKVAELTEAHFCRAFKKSTGVSPSRYQIRLRIELAQQLLRQSNDTVIDIALQVGYQNPGHFSQLFKREVGVTPVQYRNGCL